MPVFQHVDSPDKVQHISGADVLKNQSEEDWIVMSHYRHPDQSSYLLNVAIVTAGFLEQHVTTVTTGLPILIRQRYHGNHWALVTMTTTSTIICLSLGVTAAWLCILLLPVVVLVSCYY